MDDETFQILKRIVRTHGLIATLNAVTQILREPTGASAVPSPDDPELAELQRVIDAFRNDPTDKPS